MRSRLALLCLLVMIILPVAACASQPSVPPKDAIVGKWVNDKGGSISFYANGTGFVPGIDGQIPSTNFSYTFTDPTHIMMNLTGQLSTIIEIRIDGDQMTWSVPTNNVSFVYTRAKS
jgi:hypothetical protein